MLSLVFFSINNTCENNRQVSHTNCGRLGFFVVRNIQNFHLSNLNKLIRKDYQYRFNGELLSMRITKKSGTILISTKEFFYQYDHAGRKISYLHNGKPIVRYFYDNIGRLQSKKFSPAGTTQGSKQTGNWTDASSWLSGILPTLSDNVIINSGQTLTIPSGEIVSAGVLNDKGILKNFGTLNMGKATTTDLYVETLKYHIRGFLRGINLDANNNLTSTLFSYKLAYEEGTNGYFDGNIRNQYWKSNIDGVQRAYEYSYDGASRLTGATYAGKAGENYALNAVSYDFNGNIKTLNRKGLKSDNTFGLIDSLAYTYQTNSNKIQKVDDKSNETASFKDVTGNDYTYWQDGSLKSDNNKGISQIDYNYLKFPQKVNFADGRWIEYEYDAEGTKLRKTLSTGKVTDYEEDEIFENNVLYQTSHDEGRIVNGEYEYNIKDHLGNLRVAFRDSLGIAKVVQYENRGAWGESLEGINYSKANRNKFNYSTYEEENDFGLGVLDAHARVYDPIVPRFWQQDILADKFRRYSPYNYSIGNPLRFIDPSGMAVQSIEGGVRFTDEDAGNAFSVLTGQKRNVSIDIAAGDKYTNADRRINYNNWAVFTVSNLSTANDVLSVFKDKSIRNLVIGAHGIRTFGNELDRMMLTNPTGLRFKSDDVTNERFSSEDVEKFIDGKPNAQSNGIRMLQNIMGKVENGGNCIFAVCYLGMSEGGVDKSFAKQLFNLTGNPISIYTYSDFTSIWKYNGGNNINATGIGGDSRLESKRASSSAYWNVIQGGVITGYLRQIILSDSTNPVEFKK